MEVTCTRDTAQPDAGVRPLLQALEAAGLPFADLHTKESSLEEIFVGILRDRS